MDLVFTRVIHADDIYSFEKEMNKVISNEANNGVVLKDIKFNSVFQGGTFASEKVLNTAILIFEHPSTRNI